MLHDPRRETDLKARLILDKAADYIEEHGWCQGAMHMKGRVCLFGALNAVSCDVFPGVDALSREITSRVQKATGCITMAAWNDTKGRTKEQVIKALRKAAQA